MREKRFQIYLHIPFCIRKCAYCDFLSFPAAPEVRRRYVEALIRQMEQCPERGRRADTVFFGGGTPSVLEGGEIGELTDALQRYFGISKGAEVTIEANPGTLSKEKLRSYRDAGINRLSLGLQSADNRELGLLGRIHTMEEFLDNYRLAREAGFRNINVDLMSALPGQTAESWLETLEKVIGLSPEHISAYSLIVEEGTPFFETYQEAVRRREAGKECEPLPSEEEERRMYQDTERILNRAGYRRYEISNYAKPGCECLHNTGYWRREDYLGLGLGASSLLGNRRFHMTEDLKAYLEGSFGEEDTCILSEKEQMEEFMFLGLRLTEGIEEKCFEEEFGIPYGSVYGEVTGKLEEQKLVEAHKGRVQLSRRGLDVSNYVMSQYLL